MTRKRKRLGSDFLASKKCKVDFKMQTITCEGTRKIQFELEG